MTPMAVERSERLAAHAIATAWRDWRWRRWIVLALCIAPWVALLAWHTSLSWFLTDDAFISFRYARNLLEGHGLVFNPGEYVEGYSNFLWVLELAALWGLFGLRPEQAAPWLSVVYTVGTLAVVLWWVARASGLRHRRLAAWIAMGLLCSSATFAAWTSGGGLETRQFTFFVVLAVACLLLRGRHRRGLVVASLALAAAALTRPEGPLIAACCFAWYAAATSASGQRWDWRKLACLVAPFVALVAAHFLFRYAYYDEWLPNTYYAKHVRPWYEAGFRYIWAAALETGLYLLLPLAMAALRQAWRSHRNLAYALPLLCIAAHMAYVLRIGGDHFEYRPLDFYWPLLAVPAAHGILGLADSLGRVTASAPRRRDGWTRTVAVALFLPVLFYCTLVQNAFLYFRTLNLNLANHPVIATVTAVSVNMAPGGQALFAIVSDLTSGLASHLNGLDVIFHRDYTDARIREWSSFEGVLREAIPEDALAADAAIGVPYFYAPALRVVDVLGLTDPAIARNPKTRPNRYRVIAHDRIPPPGYLERRNVNFKPQPLAVSARLALARTRYAVRVGPDRWMPFDAFDHEWVLDRFDGRPVLTAEDVDGVRVISDFEEGLGGWQRSDESIRIYDVLADPPLGNGGGSYQSSQRMLTSSHPDHELAAIATARSPLFTADANDCLGFLIAGTNSERTGLRLLVDGIEAKVWHVDSGVWRGWWQASHFYPVTYALADVADVADATLQLELFDYDTKGVVLLDHVTLTPAEDGHCAGEGL